MDKFVIQGGVPLEGELAVSGSKNSALPALAACLLTSEAVTLDRIPAVRDIRTMLELIRHIGAEVQIEGGQVRIAASDLQRPEAPYELVKTMRASSLVLGPLVARCGRARVSLPGGCAIGTRPINLHVSGLESLGARVRQEHGYIEADAPNGLEGASVHFDRITVTGTEDLLMAAVLARGETVIENAAREPEVADLAHLLTRMGAVIEGAGTSTIRVRGVSKLRGTAHTIIADRIEAGTFLIAGALTRGDVRVSGCVPEHLGALIVKLRQAGADVVDAGPNALRVSVRGRLKSVDATTEEHPGFATDLQAQFMALMTQAEGISFITETIFENRFMHAQELARMGANIRLEGRQAAAQGETTVDRVYHIDRGYERIEAKLAGAGARIRRISQERAMA